MVASASRMQQPPCSDSPPTNIVKRTTSWRDFYEFFAIPVSDRKERDAPLYVRLNCQENPCRSAGQITRAREPADATRAWTASARRRSRPVMTSRIRLL
jgi:hypothetical protein